MLPGGTDPLYRSVLAAAHERYIRVEVWAGDTPVELLGDTITGEGPLVDPDTGGLVVLPGSSVSASLSSPVARNLSLVVPIETGLNDDTVAPYGNEIRVWMGARLGDGSQAYTWQVFAGKIQDDRENPDAATRSIICADYGQDIVDHDFLQPRASDPILLQSEFELLVRDAFPRAQFGAHDLPSRLAPPLQWEFDRTSALDEMLTSVGAIWWPLADGTIVARRYPWTQPGDPVITLTDREGGVILSIGRARSRSQLYNAITVTGERLNGDAPVYATESDDTPTSVTFVGGKFGIRSRLLRRQTPATQGGAQSAALDALRVSITPVEQWAWRQVPDAATELGDITGLDLADGRTAVQVVTSFTLPVDAHSAMNVNGRSQVVSLVASGGDLS